MAVLTTIVMSGGLAASVANKESKTEPHSLALLSSIATMVSENLPTEKIHQRDRQLGFSHSIKSKKTPDFSRSLSRTVSSRNLLQQVPSTTSLPRSCSSRNLMQRASATSLSTLSRKRRKLQHTQEDSLRENEWRMDSNLPLGPCEALTVPSTVLSKKQEISTKTINANTLVKTNSSNDGTIHSPSEEIMRNVYQAHEMQLPDELAIGSILKIGNSKNDTGLDEYNHEIVSNTPMEIPPRLPSASESYMIAERSRQEKSNWGWYA